MADDKPKSQAASEMGRRRMAALTPEQRTALGKRAAEARWGKARARP